MKYRVDIFVWIVNIVEFVFIFLQVEVQEKLDRENVVIVLN